MYLNSAFQAGNVVAELAQDVWHKRDKLVKGDEKLFLSYRLSVSDHEADVDENFYVHYVVTRERWYATLSSEPPFTVDHSKLIFRDDPEDWDYRMESYRHYAFNDLLERAVREYIEQIQADMTKPGDPYLWDTFPLEEFYVKEEVSA